MDSITACWLIVAFIVIQCMLFDNVNRINLQYFTDVSCLVKFSNGAAVVVSFMNLDADATHVDGDVAIIVIVVVDAICLLILIHLLLIPILLIT